MRLWRALAWDERAPDDAPGGPLWFPRRQQGEGRHDNPDRYGCLYASEDSLSALAEQLAPFRGSGQLRPSMLIRAGLPLGLAALRLPDRAVLVDLDDPAVLSAHRLRPSGVATRKRPITQAQAAALHAEHGDVAGLRWWSTLESSWINCTVFDRAADALAVEHVDRVGVDHPIAAEAAEFLGLR